MALPFVSRGRFEDAEKRIAVLEQEREKLWDRILLEAGAKPMFRPEAPKAVIESAKPEQNPQEEAPRRLTPMEISSKATAAKKKEHEATKVLANI